MAPIPQDVDVTDPSFDPSSLTVAQLRSFLQHQGVILPSTARKPALIQAFREQVDSMGSGGQGSTRVSAHKKTKPRQSAPAATIQPRLSSSSSSSGLPRSTTSKAVNRELDDHEEEEPAFSDFNPFQSPSGNESTGQGMAASKGKKTRRKTVDSSAGSRQMTSSPPPEEDNSVKKRMPSTHKESSSRSGSGIGYSSSPPPRSTSASFKNFMDPGLAATTKPRVIDAVKRGIFRFSPAPKKEESDVDEEEDEKRAEEEQERRLEELQEEEELDPEEDSMISSDSEGVKADASRDAYSSPPRNPSAQVLSKARRVKSKLSKQTYLHNSEELSTGEKALQVLWATLMVAAVLWGLWYVRESKNVGFCDTGSDSNDLLRSRQRDVLARAAKAALRADDSYVEDDDDDSLLSGPFVPQSFRPSCSVCPSHAVCNSGSLQRCASPDYVLSPSIWIYFPILPKVLPLSKITPQCVPDAHKLILAAELGDEVRKVLSSWRGGVLCGGIPPHKEALSLGKGKLDETAPLYRFSLPEKELKDDLADRRDKDLIDDGYFSQLWDLALEELERRGTVLRISSSVLDTLDPTKSSPDLLVARNASVSLTCSAKLAFGSFLQKTKLYLITAILGLALVSWLRYKFRKERGERKKVKELVGVALERLQEQEYSHAVDPVLNPEPYLPTSHLRDHVLSSEHSTKARQRLWARVARIVEENANVRTRQAQRRGEWLRVWEWVGAVGSGMVRSRSSNPTSDSLKSKSHSQIEPKSETENYQMESRDDQVMVEKRNGKGVSMR